MSVYEFKITIQLILFWVLVLIKKTFELEQQLHQNQSILYIAKLKIFFKEKLMGKNWDNVNLLPTLKKTHSLKVVEFENFKLKKFNEYNLKISKVLYHM